MPRDSFVMIKIRHDSLVLIKMRRDSFVITQIPHDSFVVIKGCGMGPWLVLVSPCFRENVVATCKIGPFLCSLDNLLQKNAIVIFFENQNTKWCSFEKKDYFWPTFYIFLVTREKLQKILQHISHSHTYTHVFCSPYCLFLHYQFWKKKIPIYQVRFLFGTSLGVDSYSRHFGTINK